MVRLHELRIQNLRGIRQLQMRLDGANCAILGPNGSGKSSVVDAIDFLLTGKIERLTGQGTGTITLGKHGPHLETEPTSAIVEGDFSCDGNDSHFTLRRSIAEPDALVSVSPGECPASLKQYVELATTTRLHLLTRRQILAFVLAEPSTRSEQVATLLRTEELDSLRKALQGASKNASDELTQLSSTKRTQEQGLLRVFKVPAMTLDDVLVRVNAHRLSLGAQAISALTPAGVLAGVPPLAQAAADPLQTQRVRTALHSATEWVRAGEARWVSEVELYAASLLRFREDTEKVRTLRALKFVQSGKLLIDGEYCPLCLTRWDRATLMALLDRRLHQGQLALSESTRIEAQRLALAGAGNGALLALRVLAEDLSTSHPTIAGVLGTYIASIEGQIRLKLLALNEIELPAAKRTGGSDTPWAIDPAWHAAVNATVDLSGRLPDLTGAQQAWDELTGVSRQLGELDVTIAREKIARLSASQLDIAHNAFIRARDEVLQEVYDAIAVRFTKYYKSVHSHDEDGFSATLTPTKAGLRLEVGFHDIGEFPPAAVHSEGHQDSMGLCLFLALVEYLSTASTGPLILDDVVMSVDRDHRRGVAKLLATEFANTQFILTTHDRVWWNQLKTVGLVKSAGQIAFPSWSLERGPEPEATIATSLTDAQQHLEKGDVPAAAHAIRRTFEMVGPEMCDALGAQVRYRSDGGWSAGEFMDGALSRYNKVLKKARTAAHSWKQDLTAIDGRIAVLDAASRQLGGERWAVNAAVHFNEWAELAPADFRPVLAAHRALLAEFSCPQCEGLVQVIEADGDDSTLRCPCGALNLNLVPKDK